MAIGPKSGDWRVMVCVIGVALVFFGAVWLAEGFGYAKSSFVIPPQYDLWAGSIAVVVGGALAAWTWWLMGKE